MLTTNRADLWERDWSYKDHGKSYRTVYEKWAILKAYEQPGLPLVVLHHSDGSEAGRVTGLVESDEFLEMMGAVR